MTANYYGRLVVIRGEGQPDYVTRITRTTDKGWVGDDGIVYDKKTSRNDNVNRRIVTADQAFVNAVLERQRIESIKKQCRYFLDTATVEQLEELKQWISNR